LTVDEAYAPPAYSVRVSRRARRARLTFTPQRELVVVVPIGFDREQIPAMLRHHDAWIRRTAARLSAARPQRALAADPIPHSVQFGCTGERWVILYTTTPTNSVSVRQAGPGRLAVAGQIDNHLLVRAALRLWITHRARAHLDPWVRRLARDHGFEVTKVTIRSQKTRWGSCSVRKSVSLNLRLMFLPSELVQYVLLHELAHTKQLNHSPAFWKLVESLDPNYRTAKSRLRTAEDLLPPWLNLSET
jgi:predicted metal-dependent hydrolase